jgi:hypothetical protein
MHKKAAKFGFFIVDKGLLLVALRMIQEKCIQEDRRVGKQVLAYEQGIDA